ncbi:chromogranin-A isoform X1 [Cricetulus griseus]|uniref:Chromogranin-A n=1 Tax=Cricetulus griseus TaxID=10029 RepID=G3HU91_CRIGR|nr:chromogranin-A isoform X1 [Cricetulus griseus]XP_027274964.1 chromogranin-A isoform X1 [Cricetulus griseus]EGW13394.1 Chromogranin-A [Cricetulus griseus]
MRSAVVLALLLCAGQVLALPVNSPMTKGDTKVMKCVVEVISDSLSKPSPMPVSPECLETLQGDERVLSILRHQNLLKELQDLALQGAKERAQQQPKQQEQQQPHSSFEDELSEVFESQSPEAKQGDATAETPPKEVVEKREDSDEVQQGGSEGTTEGPRPQAIPEPGQKSSVMGNSHAPGEDAAINTQMPASLPNQDDVDSQATGDSERGLGTQQQAGKAKQEEEEEVREKAEPEEIPTAESSSQPEYEAIQKDEGQSESHAVDGGGKTRASEALSPKGELELSQKEEDREDVMAGPPQGLFPGGKSQELEHQQEEEERLSREWEDKRWSRMDQLAKELTAEKRLQGEDDPDRSMKLSFRARAYGFRDPRPQLRRGWRPSSREESVETRGDFEEKKEEEGSANRRAEDQELESLSAIEAELEKVAHQLQALRRG